MASYKDLGKGKYKIEVHLGYDAKGKRIRRYRTVEATGVRQLNRLMNEFEIEAKKERLIKTDRMNFSDFVEMWKENYAHPNLEPSTIQVYEELLRHVTPHFEKKYMKDISTFHIVQFFTAEKKDEKGQLEKKYNVLKSIFKYAVTWGIITEDPMTQVEKPKARPKPIRFYDKEEIGELLIAIKELGPRHQILVKLALFGGLRRGEILGIAYDQVDFKKNTIHVKRSLQNTKEEGLRLKKTKTENERTVTFPEDLMQKLYQYYKQQLKLRTEMGTLWKGFKDIEGKEVTLFAANEYGIPYTPNSVTVFWGRFTKRMKLKRIRFQDLRHSSASLILSEGVNMKVVQQRLGHKDIKTTMNVYSHVTEKDDEKASNVFDQFYI